MNTTTTHRRFAFRRLLPCLALLVTAVSSCVPLNTYSGRRFTPAAVTYNSIDTYADLAAYCQRCVDASTLTIRGLELAKKAIESRSAETLAAAAEVLLSAARAKQECLTDLGLNVCLNKMPDKEVDEWGDIEDSMCSILDMAERYGAGRAAVGRVYYDHARTLLACSSKVRAVGAENEATVLHNSAIPYMQEARARGIAEAAAYLRTH